MNWLDAVLLLLIAWSVVTAFRKGFTREVIGVISVIVGLLVGAWFYRPAASFLLPYVSSPAAANFAGFLLVFCGVLLLGAIVSTLVRKFLRLTGLSFFDRILGAGFGLIRGGLIGVALVTALMAFSPKDHPPASVVGSRVAPYVVDGARVVVTVAPHDLKTGFHNTYEQVKTAWRAALDQSHANGTEKRANEKSN
jgi:membrane protein required for colicin V production